MWEGVGMFITASHTILRIEVQPNASVAEIWAIDAVNHSLGTPGNFGYGFVAGNRITEEYIPNTCAALALAGFVGLAPNLFHPIPEGTPNNDDAYAKYIADHTDLDRLDDVQLGASYLRAQPFVDPGGMGVIGFCSGGRLALLLGARSREVDAVVAFHPAPMKEKELNRLKVPVQVHHGTADHAVPYARTQELEKALRAQKTPVEVFLYEDLDHGFLAYTRPYYSPEAAKLAWSRTLEFLSQHLEG